MYRTVDACFWTDPKVRKLSPEAKLFCLYLITNPHSHVGGIYYLPDAIIQLETGLSGRGIDTLWDTLSGAGFSRRDKKTDVVWVIKMFAYQGRGEKNERAVASQLCNLHNSNLVNDFLNVYKGVKRWVKDRVSIGYPAQDESGTPEQEQEQDIPPISPKGECGEFPSCFELWWERYPKLRRNGKRKVYVEYQRAGKVLVARGMTKDTAVGFLQNRCIEYATSQLGSSEYACNPAKWLSQGMYDDDPASWVRAVGKPEEEAADEPIKYSN